MEMKEIFDKAENGVLTYEQFVKATQDAGAKFTDLSEGKYVAKAKYEDDLSAKDKQIGTLNDTISTRDTDLATLKKQLEDAGADNATITKLTEDMAKLQTKYDTEMSAYQAQLSKQAYEFAVKEFANTKEFTSQAAKRDFVQTMLNKELKMENNQILGADDFAKVYAENNSDAFKVANPNPAPNPKPQPHFVDPTGGKPNGGGDDNPFKFNFTGVRINDTNK